MKTIDSIQFTQQQGIATLTLNRPDIRNAFDDTMIHSLTQHIEKLNKDSTTRAIILRGQGEHFSAGANIDWMRHQAKRSTQENYQDALKLAKLLQSLNEVNKPTIALIQGAVFGGAIGLVACCDIVLAATDTIFCFSEVKLGLAPAVVGPYVLNIIGPKASRRYMLTADPFHAAEAHRLGLVDEILPFEQLASRANELAEHLLKNAPRAVGVTKQLIRDLRNPSMSSLSNTSNISNISDISNIKTTSLVEYTAKLIAELRVSSEGQEGLSAFLEKRAPRWTDTLHTDPPHSA